MSLISDTERKAFFQEVDEASQRATWCAVATVAEGEPRVRMVHPTWEGETLWFATGTRSPKVRQMQANPVVDIQYQVGPPTFTHILVRGRARIVSSLTEKKRVWDVIDYDLSQFWSDGPEDPNYSPVEITPTRVEYSNMFGGLEKRVWRSTGA